MPTSRLRGSCPCLPRSVWHYPLRQTRRSPPFRHFHFGLNSRLHGGIGVRRLEVREEVRRVCMKLWETWSLSRRGAHRAIGPGT